MVDAARAGLQDSSPRSALLSLHARVEGIQPDAWRDPILAQVFGPRGAIYVVPRSDVGVFTLGLLPMWDTVDTLDLLVNPQQPDVQVRLLPPDDPYVNRLAAPLLIPDERKRKLLWPQSPPPGAVTVGIDVVGTWRRRGPKVTVHPWVSLDARTVGQFEATVSELPVGTAEHEPSVSLDAD